MPITSSAKMGTHKNNMALFQNSVLNKYLNTQDNDTITNAYKIFSTYFHDKIIQQNIRVSKKEQFQEGFFKRTFCCCIWIYLKSEWLLVDLEIF